MNNAAVDGRAKPEAVGGEGVNPTPTYAPKTSGMQSGAGAAEPSITADLARTKASSGGLRHLEQAWEGVRAQPQQFTQGGSPAAGTLPRGLAVLLVGHLS